GWAQSAMRGLNAAVVGILLAALYDPVWTSAVLGPPDFALALVAFVLLAVWQGAPPVVLALSPPGGTGAEVKGAAGRPAAPGCPRVAQASELSFFWISGFGTAPTTWSRTFPSFTKRMVGMERTPKRAASAG